MAETIRLRVVGPAKVDGVATGGVVELDPGVYNIEALVAGGHVEVLAAEPEPAAAKVRKGAESS